MEEIRNALNAGLEVITHTDAVSVPGWSGAGYIIYDADTGGGAFKIAGGGNGGQYSDDYWSNYLNLFSEFGIQLNLAEVIGLIVFGSIPKSWVGETALLGSKNPLTSVLRAILSSNLGKLAFMRGFVIPLGTLIGIFIGIYNATILIEGFFYAIYIPIFYDINFANNFRRKSNKYLFEKKAIYFT